VAPTALGPAVVQRAGPEGAPRTAERRATETHVDDETFFFELDRDHPDGWDREQAAEYGGASHPDLLDRFVRFRDATNLSSVGVLFFLQETRRSIVDRDLTLSTKGAGPRDFLRATGPNLRVSKRLYSTRPFKDRSRETGKGATW